MSAPGPRSGARVSSEPVVPTFPRVRVADLAAVVPGSEVRGDDATVVTEASFDSRQTASGSVFFCVVGEHSDGHDFAGHAVGSGAAVLVEERWLDLDVPQIRVASVRASMGPMSALVFGRPAAAMRTVGVTGTNGKTTTTYLLESIFEAAGWPAGLVGTTGARVAGQPVELARTTPEAPDLHRLLALMRDRGIQALTMEVSSHALDQHRVDGIVFDVALFTNLSQDHLDYHPSMEAYFLAKARLFDPARSIAGAVNVDDPAGRRLAGRATVPITTFAVRRDADVRATRVEAGPSGVSFEVDGIRVRSPMIGSFNVWNALGALAAARVLGVDPSVAARGIEAVTGVPGRMERVDDGTGPLVVVDYAHTPDSIRSVLRAARPLTAGRLIVVFGCGGDRDRDKRPLMGTAATSAADLSVITSDNPRSEDPSEIVDEIERGAVDGGGRSVIEVDRRAAIRLAVEEAGPGDLVVIAGRGHERGQEVDGRVIPFDDRDVAREELRALGDRR
jgi:UDP-N-acetylmuramoyl-L-alanyl-D-glutamate--2,6-diaminopimelate ligase